ncbi:MAG: ABC transporter permease [Chloroflexota bacterium]|nr:MAG: peptide ABC transporter permease [Chloroflexota bacterium]
MALYILRRLVQVIPTLFGIFTVLFILAYLMPSDPLRAVLGEQYRRLPPEVIEGIREELGLNDSFIERYVQFLGQLLRGDLGRSYILSQDVSEIIAYRFPRTLQLMIGGMFVALIMGIPIGIIAAEKQYTWIDHFLMFISLVGVSMPVFWLALIAQMLLTQSKYGIALFPVAGYEQGSLIHMVLPSLVIGTQLTATLARITRTAMLEVRGQDYIVTARAKGLPYRMVLIGHQLRNALIPIITIIGLNIGGLLGGSIVTETVFNWPGLGRAIVPAIERRDTPVILGILLFGSFLFIIINLITDLIYALVNPRIRYS